MTTALSAKLVRGALTVDLNTAPFEIAEGFTPPGALVHPIIAAGTSANRYGGGTVVGRTASDRSFSFGVHIDDASTGAIETAARRLQSMLDQAGDPDTPLYLVYRSTTDTTLAPLWGQAALYYEVSYGTLILTGLYSVSDLRARALPNCTVSLTLKPLAQGVAQLAATATGGILPDQWGTADGAERGLIVPEATTNKMTNPVFGAATYNTGWTAGANLTASQNTNPAYCLPQTQSSAFLQSAGAGNGFRQSINVGDTNTHYFSALVMRPDLAAVTSADCQINYSVNLTTTYRNLGSGLWLLTATAAGIAAGTVTGVTVSSGRSVYLLAFQTEEKAYPTQLGWGDLLGWTWTGTAHASTSTRTVASCKVAIDDTVLRAAQGSIAFTWVAPMASTTYSAANYWFWDANDGGTGALALQCYYDGTSHLAVLRCNAVLASVAITFAAGDVLAFHGTWGPTGGMTLYKNGASAATGVLTPVAPGASLFIGLANGGANLPGGTFADFRTFAYELTAAEVLADYTNTSPVSGATADVCSRVGAIPWRWTNAGDDTIAAVTGLVNTVQKYNWCVFGGIAGSTTAQAQIKLFTSGSFSGWGGLYLSRLSLPFFFNPATLCYADLSGVADVGTSSGDAFSAATSVNTASIVFGSITPKTVGYSLVQGKELYLFARLKDAGANLTAAAAWVMVSVGSTPIVTDYTAIAADATMRLFKAQPFILPRLRHVYADDTTTIALIIYLNLKRSAAGAANANVDFLTMLPRPLTQLVFSSNTSQRIIVKESLAVDITSGYSEPVQVAGDVFALDPGVYNVVQHLLGSPAASYPVTSTFVYTSTWVTPRYALL